MNILNLLNGLLILTLPIKSASNDDPIFVKKCDCNCDCVDRKYCKYAERLLGQTNGDTPSLQRCNYAYDLVCCPREENITISEMKCMEFTAIKNFCPSEGLIKDGIVAEPNEIPFMVSIQVKINETYYEWICGGSLIDPKYVITAAHCFDYIENFENVYVLLGAHYTNSTDKRQRFNLTIHDDYEKSNFTWGDIALLKLHSNANITKKIKPACLAKTNGSEIETFMAAGWGYNGTMNNKPKVLLKTTLRKMPYDNCTYPKGANIKSLLCTAPNDTRSGDVCQGDSGGPIFTGYPDRDNCQYAIFGVISNGLECSAPKSRTVLTRISYFRDWIEKTVWPEEKNP